MTLIDCDATRLEDICMAGEDALPRSCRDKQTAHKAKEKEEDLHD